MFKLKKVRKLIFLKHVFEINQKGFLGILIISLMMSFVGLIFYFSIAYIIDNIVPEKLFSQLYLFASILIAASIIVSFLFYVQNFIFSKMKIKINNLFIPKLWFIILKLPLSFFRQFQPPDLILRLNSILTIRNILWDVILKVILIFVLFIYFLNMFIFSASLTLFVLVLILFYFFIYLFFSYYLSKNSLIIMDNKSFFSNLVFGFLNSIYKIKVNKNQQEIYNKWFEIYSKKEDLIFKNKKILSILNCFSEVFFVLSIMIFLFSYSFIRKNVSHSVGSFIMFFTFFIVVLYSVKKHFYELVLSVVHGFSELERLKPLLSHFSYTQYLALTPILLPQEDSKALSGKININNLSFSIKNKTILSNISFQINAGECIVLDGEVGSGKSTLIKLMLGFEKPIQGSIYYDGINLNSKEGSLIRKQFGVVLENSQLISGSILYNICGAHSFSEEEAWEIASLCELKKDIKKMPMGMNTWVCEGAFTFSSTQKYLILLARALMMKPKILFFDDVLNYLDEKTLSSLLENFLKLKLTIVIATHKKSILKKADRIFTLKEGRLIL